MDNKPIIISMIRPARVKSREDFCKEIMDIDRNFEFSSVHQAMVAMNWKWCMDGGMKVPTIEQVIEHGIEQLKAVVKHVLKEGQTNRYSIESGGFRSEFDPDKGLTLKFILTDWEAEDSLDPMD